MAGASVPLIRDAPTTRCSRKPSVPEQEPAAALTGVQLRQARRRGGRRRQRQPATEAHTQANRRESPAVAGERALIKAQPAAVELRREPVALADERRRRSERITQLPPAHPP